MEKGQKQRKKLSLFGGITKIKEGYVRREDKVSEKKDRQC